jgi:hypothetical protein
VYAAPSTQPTSYPIKDRAFINAMRDTGYVDGNSNASGSGVGLGADSEVRPTAAAVIYGESVSPRKGSYFIRSEINNNNQGPVTVGGTTFPQGYYKDYNRLNNAGGTFYIGDINGRLDKSRNAIAMDNEFLRIPYADQDVWVGFSIYIPASWYHEDKDLINNGAVSLMPLGGGPPTTASATQVTLDIRGASSTPNVASRWCVDYYLGAASVYEDQGGAQKYVIQKDGTVANVTTNGNYGVNAGLVPLGESVGGRTPEQEFADDVGKWTDFVFHVRVNPFAAPTNPGAAGIPNAINYPFPANTGALRIWKSSGPSRVMKQVCNLVNQPIGIIPWAGNNMSWSFRLYKYSWKRYQSYNPSNYVYNPATGQTGRLLGSGGLQGATPNRVWCGYDEIRAGSTQSHGTTYADVHPDQEPMPA